MNTELLTFAIFQAFSVNLKIDGEIENIKLSKKISKKYDECDETDKLYYSNYALSIAKSLLKTVEKIREVTMDVEDNKYFLLLKQKKTERKVFIINTNITIRNIIPEKLWNICGYRKNTNFSKKYIESYNEINDIGSEKISKYTNYSEVSDKIKDKYLYEPICTLITESLNKKRKCSLKLYDYIFNYSDDIYVKAYKTRYYIYDFSIEHDEIESVKMTQDENYIDMEFNNGAKFDMRLKTNSSKIRDRLSLKFTINFKNIDDMFCVKSKTV